jgi:hypothetical protein
MNQQVGTPGRSAAERASQNRQRAERLLVQADYWDSGAYGERAVAAVLSGLPSGSRVLHDLTIPGSAGNIDHVVVTPTGIFVIDTKNYRCTLTAGDGTLWRGRYPIRKECNGVAWQASVLSDLVGHQVQPMLCFVGTRLPKPVQQLGSVIACTDAALVATIKNRWQSATAVDVDQIVNQLNGLVRFRGGVPAHGSHSASKDSYSLQPTKPSSSKSKPRWARTLGRTFVAALSALTAIGLVAAASDHGSNGRTRPVPPPITPESTVATRISNSVIQVPLRSDATPELVDVSTTSAPGELVNVTAITTSAFALPFVEFHCETPGGRWVASFASNETRADPDGFNVWVLGKSGNWMYWGTFRRGASTPMSFWVESGEVVQTRFGRDGLLGEDTATQTSVTAPVDNC